MHAPEPPSAHPVDALVARVQSDLAAEIYLEARGARRLGEGAHVRVGLFERVLEACYTRLRRLKREARARALPRVRAPERVECHLCGRLRRERVRVELIPEILPVHHGGVRHVREGAEAMDEAAPARRGRSTAAVRRRWSRRRRLAPPDARGKLVVVTEQPRRLLAVEVDAVEAGGDFDEAHALGARARRRAAAQLEGDIARAQRVGGGHAHERRRDDSGLAKAARERALSEVAARCEGREAVATDGHLDLGLRGPAARCEGAVEPRGVVVPEAGEILRG